MEDTCNILGSLWVFCLEYLWTEVLLWVMWAHSLALAATCWMHAFTAACLCDAKSMRKGPDDKAADTGQLKVADSRVACPKRNGPKNDILVAGLLSQEENYYRDCRGQTYNQLNLRAPLLQCQCHGGACRWLIDFCLWNSACDLRNVSRTFTVMIYVHSFSAEVINNFITIYKSLCIITTTISVKLFSWALSIFVFLQCGANKKEIHYRCKLTNDLTRSNRFTDAHIGSIEISDESVRRSQLSLLSLGFVARV